jgi:predicted glycosyltransferase
LTFHGIEVAGHPAYAVADPARVVVAFRPPAAESHYYSRRSGGLSSQLLAWLARQPNLHVIYLPRYDWQATEPRALTWAGTLEIPAEPIHFLSLLKAVDLVISSGGTMLREAAVLEIPAYSIFRSRIGGVDRQLEAGGRLTFIESAADFDRIALQKRTRTYPDGASHDAMADVLGTVLRLV